MQNRKVILIVDDSQLVNDRLAEMLQESRPVYTIIRANNYFDALQLLDERAVDIVLLDINLPEVSGIELLKRIKQSYSLVKVIMCTNHSAKQYRWLCKSLGADYFFDKSTEFEKIPGAIRQLDGAVV